MGLAAVTVDLGRMYVIKSELQAFTEAAALNAALRLDGSANAIAGARNAAAALATGPHAMKWDMGTQPITEIAATFAQGDRFPDPATWQAEPRSSGDCHFVRVVATAPAPLIFLRAFQALLTDFSTVAASSVAAKTGQAARLVQ